MKIKFIRLLLLSTAVVLLVGCGGSVGPDIEATVEARLSEERAAEATLEARVQNRVEATLEVAPTGTPMPEQPATPTAMPTQVPPAATPSPTPTPTPTQVPPTPTPTPTLAPTATPTPIPTPTPTHTPTPTVTPTPTAVFAECLKWEGTPATQTPGGTTVEISLSPGWNLISLPGTPSDTSVDTILAGATGITTVVTTNVPTANGMPCNPTQSPVTYTSDTLTRISNNKAYWVHSNTITSIKVNTPALTFSSPPPAISVRAGWNLVPVISIGGAAIGSSISADTYFGSAQWSSAKSFSAITGEFTTLLPNTGARLVIGQGYYFSVTSDGILVP